MKIIKGTSVSKGIAFGHAKFYKKEIPVISKTTLSDREQEVKRFYRASADTFNLLQAFYERTIHSAGEDGAKIFSIQQMMLRDRDFVETILEHINEDNVSAEYAVYMTYNKFKDFFMSMDNEIMQSKSFDMKDISSHIIRFLTQEKKSAIVSDMSGTIFISDSFVPSQMVLLNLVSANAAVSEKGMKKSHVSYLARKLEIPSVINVSDFNESMDGKYIAVDGFKGEIIIEPDSETIEKLKKRQSRYVKVKKIISKVMGKHISNSQKNHVKLIALDLDGTIINNATEISEKSVEAINKADEHGIKVAVCTGRVLGEIPKEVREIEGISYFITSNGSSIMNCHGNVIYSDTIPLKITDKILKVLSDYNCLIDLYIDGKGFMQESDLEKLDFYNVSDGFEEVLKNSRTFVDDIIEYYYAVRPHVEKINLFFADAYERREVIYRIGMLEDAPQIAYSMEYNLEITSNTCCKGEGLKYLSKILNVESNEIMAIGDSNNDISMLEFAGISVAMGNASSVVKDSSVYVTDSCTEDGAANAIEKYALG